MLIWTIFFVFALIGAVLLLFHVILEMNRLERQIEETMQKLRDRYGR